MPVSELTLNTLLDRIHEGVAYAGRDAVIKTVNRRCTEILGLEAEALVGTSFEDRILSGEQESFLEYFELARSGEPVSIEVGRLVRGDRSILLAAIDLCPVPGPGPGGGDIQIVIRDTTVRAETTSALKEIEQKVQLLIENMADAVYLMDLGGRCVLVNPAGERLFGRAKSEILLRDEAFLFSREDAERIRAASLEVVKQQTRLEDKAYHTIRGERCYLHTIRLPYYSVDGTVSGVLAIIRDLTAEKGIESRLHMAERRFQALFNRGGHGVIVLGLDGEVLEVSEKAEGILGYAPNEMLGEPIDRFVSEINREDHRVRMKETLESGSSPVYEQFLRRKNGSIIPSEVSLSIVEGDKGQPIHFQMILRDITERKRFDVERNDLLENLRQRTRQIQTAFEVSKSIASTLDLGKLLEQTVEIIKKRFSFYYVGVFLLDGDEAVLKAGSGKQGRKMLKAGHRLNIAPDSMIGWCIQERRARIALDVGKDKVRFENPMTPKTRSEIALPLLVHGEPIGALTVQSEVPAAFKTEDIAVLQIMADQLAIAVQNALLHEEVTAYAEELEDRVASRTSQLEAANKELESFSYSISHDLRAPLRAVHGYTNIMLETFSPDLSDEANQYLDKIRSNALRMGELIDDILAFSRMGRKPLRKASIDPNLLIREVLEDLRPAMEGRDIDLLVEPLPVLMADQTLLKQVFTNLLSNAVKFSRTREKAIIGIGCEETDRGKAIFIQDNGVGFDMKYADRIFGVFQRLHRADEFEGTGVGLAIVHRIIERHGGAIWFDSQEGQGTTFYVQLPPV